MRLTTMDVIDDLCVRRRRKEASQFCRLKWAIRQQRDANALQCEAEARSQELLRAGDGTQRAQVLLQLRCGVVPVAVVEESKAVFLTEVAVPSEKRRKVVAKPVVLPCKPKKVARGLEAVEREVSDAEAVQGEDV